MRLGSDPETFLIDRNTGKFKSVIGLIGANKWNPAQIPGMLDGFTLQEDNVALEFGVPPAATKEEFVKNIRSVLLAGLEKLPQTRFSRLSCVQFPESEMDNPSAWVFGCEPDYNAWTGLENTKPHSPHPFLRSAGGHIHIETSLDKRTVIKCIDLCAGVPSVLMDSGSERRQLYGKAGAYRPKPYGAEYRTLSNFWVFRPRLIEWAWDAVDLALQVAEHMPELLDEIGDDVQACINNGDKKLAERLVKEFNLEVV